MNAKNNCQRLVFSLQLINIPSSAALSAASVKSIFDFRFLSKSSLYKSAQITANHFLT
ncbi:MAG TPA: hypothetical protein VF273_04555 [Pelobium sp.]